jgi:hypothetical protein
VETLTDTLTELGKDPDEHLEQRARELKRIKDLEEKYGVTFPGLGAGAKEQNDGGKDEAGDDDARAAGRPVLQVIRP